MVKDEILGGRGGDGDDGDDGHRSSKEKTLKVIEENSIVRQKFPQ